MTIGIAIFMAALLQGAPQSAVGDRLPRGPQGLGIGTRDLSRAEREALPAGEPRGVIVYHVAPGSPADGAGVRTGQRVVRVDSRAVAHDAALGWLLRASPAGRALQLELRDGSLPHSVSEIGRAHV